MLSRKYRLTFLIVCLFLLVLSFQVAFAQDPSPSPSPTVTPSPKPTPITVKVKDKNIDSTIKLFEGSSIELTTSDSSINLISSDQIDFPVTQNNKDGVIWTMKVNSSVTDKSQTQISAQISGAEREIGFSDKSGKIIVQGFKIPAPSSISLQMNKPKNLSDIFNPPLSPDLLNQLDFSPVTAELATDQIQLTGAQTGNYTLNYGLKGGSLDKSLTVKVQSNISHIEIDSANRTNNAYVGSLYTLHAKAIDQNGGLSPDIDKIVWSIPEGERSGKGSNNQNENVVLMPKAHGEIDIYILKASDTPITITAKIKGDDSSAQSYSFFAKGEQKIIGFDNVELQLNMMDNRTAKDLFGGVATKDYMIAKLRIFNKVPEDKNGGPSSSILFFSEGLEVNVSLEKRALENSRVLANNQNGGWKLLDYEDIEYINRWNYIKNRDDILIGKYIKLDGTICTEIVKRMSGDPNCQISATEFDRLSFYQELTEICKINPSNPLNSDDTNSCQEKLADKHWIGFRPYAFLIIASTHDRRVDRSIRSRTLFAASAVAGLTSFATAFSGPAKNSGLLFGLDKFSNLFQPAFENLIPSRREVERKNILEMALQPSEEVPYGKEINKVVFIPRTAIQGILPGYEVRISSVSVYKIKAEASVVQKQKIENR